MELGAELQVVLGTGLEPARLSATASKTVVYANSTTRAFNWLRDFQLTVTLLLPSYLPHWAH